MSGASSRVGRTRSPPGARLRRHSWSGHITKARGTPKRQEHTREEGTLRGSEAHSMVRGTISGQGHTHEVRTRGTFAGQGHIHGSGASSRVRGIFTGREHNSGGTCMRQEYTREEGAPSRVRGTQHTQWSGHNLCSGAHPQGKNASAREGIFTGQGHTHR